MKKMFNAAALLIMMCMALPMVAQSNLTGLWFTQISDPAGDVPMVFNLTFDFKANKAMSYEVVLKIDAQLDETDNTTRMLCEMTSTGSGDWKVDGNKFYACADKSTINTELTKLDFPLMDPAIAAMVKDPIKAEFAKEMPAAINELIDGFCTQGFEIISNEGDTLVLASGDEELTFKRL